VRRTVGDDADAVLLDQIDLGLRHHGLGRLEFPRQPIQVLHVVFGALAVERHLVVARTSGKVRGQAVTRNGAVGDAIAVDILVAPPLSDPLEQFGGELLAARERAVG
jgi:hypothetical protein